MSRIWATNVWAQFALPFCDHNATRKMKRDLAQMIGILLLLSLMVFALGNDFFRLFTGGFG